MLTTSSKTDSTTRLQRNHYRGHSTRVLWVYRFVHGSRRNQHAETPLWYDLRILRLHIWKSNFPIYHHSLDSNLCEPVTHLKVVYTLWSVCGWKNSQVHFPQILKVGRSYGPNRSPWSRAGWAAGFESWRLCVSVLNVCEHLTTSRYHQADKSKKLPFFVWKKNCQVI